NSVKKRIFIIESDSITIRFDQINNIEEKFAIAAEVGDTLAKILNIEAANLSTKITADVILDCEANDFMEIKGKNLVPVGINKEDIPGEVEKFISRIYYTLENYEYDLSVDPYSEEETTIFVDLDMDAVNDEIITISSQDLLEKMAVLRQHLEGTVGKIVGKW
ncbi:hypothetical protein, partial [Neobacillus drentensis]|uniref:hypothetical protein n=1 Tax=Neobacillus drentensis TaxID=220684 RepID=UPI003000AB47